MTKYMLFRIWGLSFFLMIFSGDITLAQCSITDLTVMPSECDDTDRFSVTIDFEFTGAGDSGFQILGNGNNYGTFQYPDLPIILEGLIGNCDIEFEFIVRDVDDPACSAFLEIGTVCCEDECTLSIVDFETSECDNSNSFNIGFDVINEFVGNAGFSVFLNDEFVEDFAYEDLPVTLLDPEAVAEGNNTLTICDNEFTDCCTDFTFLNPCLCDIVNITSEIVDCSANDSTYFVIIDFEHSSSNDSFQMGYSNNGTNEFLGTFSYNSLPVTAGPLAFSDQEQEILIVDQQDFFCFSNAFLGVVDDCTINCQISNVFAEAYMCEEGEYFMDVEFDTEDIEGFSFDILVDGQSYGNFNYGESLYTVGPIPSNCDEAPVVVIQDSEIEGCSDFYNLPEPVCCLPDCNLLALEANTVCGINTLTINGEFENNGVMFSGFYFIQFAGTIYGPFIYGDFTFSLEVPLVADGSYSLSINDSIDPNCEISTEVAVSCEQQPCIIFDVVAEAEACEENQFFATIEFEFGGEVSDSFSISANGNNLGTFAYGAGSYPVGPLEGDCETIYEFVVQDKNIDGCNDVFVFEEPVCCDPPCVISDVEILQYTCISESMISSFVLNFSTAETPSDQFVLIIDGQEIATYFYADLPIFVDMEMSNVFLLQINDAVDADCSFFEALDLDCEGADCSISDVAFDLVDCDMDMGTYFVQLTGLNFTGVSDSFNIFLGDDLVIRERYDNLPIFIGPLELMVEYTYTLADVENSNCQDDFTVFLDDCTTGVEENVYQDVRINQFPNQLEVINNESDRLQIRMYALSGALMHSSQLDSASNHAWSTGHLPTGVYVLNILGSRGIKTTKIFVP